MTELIFKNNAESALAVAMGGADLTLQVDSGEGALFPDPGASEAFIIQVTSGSQTAYMTCTGRSTDVLTVTRTDSYSFPVDSTVRHVINAATYETFIQKEAYRTYAGSPDGLLTTDFVGEEVLDSTNDVWYKSVDTTNWKLMNGVGS